MAYTKQNFADGQILKAEQLNHMEEGIAAAAEAMGDVEAALDGIIRMQNALIGGEEA